MAAIAPHVPRTRPRRGSATAILSAAVPIAAIAIWAHCAPEAYVNVTVGPVALDLDVPVAAIPPAALDGGAFRKLACDAAARCPSPSGTGVVGACVDGACAFTATVEGISGVLDLDTYGSFDDFSSMMQALGVERALWRVSGVSPPHVVGPIELFWGDQDVPTATAEHHLGTFPRFDPAEGVLASELAVDPVGVRAFSDHVLAGARRVRFRARGLLLLQSGGAVPSDRLAGTLTLIVNLDAKL